MIGHQSYYKSPYLIISKHLTKFICLTHLRWTAVLLLSMSHFIQTVLKLNLAKIKIFLFILGKKKTISNFCFLIWKWLFGFIFRFNIMNKFNVKIIPNFGLTCMSELSAFLSFLVDFSCLDINILGKFQAQCFINETFLSFYLDLSIFSSAIDLRLVAQFFSINLKVKFNKN